MQAVGEMRSRVQMKLQGKCCTVHLVIKVRDHCLLLHAFQTYWVDDANNQRTFLRPVLKNKRAASSLCHVS